MLIDYEEDRTLRARSPRSSSDLPCAAENPCPLSGTPPWFSAPPVPPKPLIQRMVPPGRTAPGARAARRAGGLTQGLEPLPASKPATSHDAILVVYRNATIAQVVGQAIASTYMAPPPPFPALPSLTSGSWVAGLASNSKGVTAVGMTVRVNPGTGAMSALDTDGGVASWASHPTVGAQHAFSFELKVSP